MSSSLKVTIVFLLFGVGWTIIADIFPLFLSVRVSPNLQIGKAILFILVSALLIFVVSNHFNTNLRKSNKDLTSNNNKLSGLSDEKVQHQKEIAQAVVTAQEAERKQIGEELHDNITQILATTKLYIDLGLENAALRDDMLKKSSLNLVEAIDELRKLSQTLTPPSLAEVGLIPSIEDLAHNVLAANKINFVFSHGAFKDESVLQDKKLAIYRIIQEQINNIVRHADAKNVLIRLENDSERVSLTVKDDGRGFDQAVVQRGIGLSNIRNRAELFSGTMETISSPGNGCTLSVSI